EFATVRVRHAGSVERPGERIPDRVGDRAVVLVARVERRDVTGVAADHRPEQARDPFRSDASEIAVDDRAGLRVQKGDGLEYRAERRALARTTLVAARDGR